MSFYHIALQQCYNTSLEKPRTRTSQFPAVLHTASLVKFFRKNLFEFHNFCKYVEQLMITDIQNSENQLDWLEGIIYGSNCQKTDSTDVAEQIKPVYNIIVLRRTILISRIQTSVPKFFCTNRS